MLSSAGVVAYRDSTAVPRGGVTGWTSGISTVYEYVVRVEASTPGGEQQARFQTYLRRDSTIKTEGPGLSDVLVTSGIAETTAPLKRWRDAKPTPSVGAIERGQNLWLLWENYELGAESGSASYDVTISIKRVRSGVGRIVASVAGALAGIARVSVRDDQADVQYTRTLAHANIIVEVVALDLQTTPAGDYAVTVQVADKAAKRTMSRTVMVTVRE
jgi:hypothetical protein